MKTSLATLLLAIAAPGAPAFAQVIDFEGLPDGTIVTHQFSAPPYGVTFELVGAPVGTGPKVARVGFPATAFGSFPDFLTSPECGITDPTIDDMPLAGQGVGCAFLTDDGDLSSEVEYPLLVTYATPVFQASGVLLDIDNDVDDLRREEWTIRARRQDETVIETLVLSYLDADAGNAVTTPWLFDSLEPIHSIEFEFTGPTGLAGLAFDNFSPSSIPADLVVSKTGPAFPAAVGDTLSYNLTVTNAGPGDASGVVLEDFLPPGVSFVSAIPSQGDCSEAGGIVTCELGDLLNSADAAVEILGVLDQVLVANTASVSATEFDGDVSNNQAAVLLEVNCGTSNVPSDSSPTVTTRLHQNAPNPFGRGTQIAFSLGKSASTEVDIYDASGRLVRHLFSDELDAGSHQLSWDGFDEGRRRVASGTYFYQLRLDGKQVETKKAVLLR